jgi:hypothetical protein
MQGLTRDEVADTHQGPGNDEAHGVHTVGFETFCTPG